MDPSIVHNDEHIARGGLRCCAARIPRCPVPELDTQAQILESLLLKHLASPVLHLFQPSANTPKKQRKTAYLDQMKRVLRVATDDTALAKELVPAQAALAAICSCTHSACGTHAVVPMVPTALTAQELD
jgi:hypothetical protein